MILVNILRSHWFENVVLNLHTTDIYKLDNGCVTKALVATQCFIQRLFLKEQKFPSFFRYFNCC